MMFARGRSKGLVAAAPMLPQTQNQQGHAGVALRPHKDQVAIRFRRRECPNMLINRPEGAGQKVAHGVSKPHRDTALAEGSANMLTAGRRAVLERSRKPGGSFRPLMVWSPSLAVLRARLKKNSRRAGRHLRGERRREA